MIYDNSLILRICMNNKPFPHPKALDDMYKSLIWDDEAADITLKLLDEKGKNTDEVWKNIRDRDGSVQHLDFLSEQEKDVFKTYAEIDQMDIIYQAANRQNYIDQGQSLNLMVHPNMPTKDINKLYLTFLASF